MQGETWDDVLEKTRRQVAPATERGMRHTPEEEAQLPGPGDPYKASGSPSKSFLTRLVCVMGKEGFQTGGKAYRFFQYVHLDSDTDFGFTRDGHIFTLRFAGMKPVEIVIRGRNLLRLCDQIHLHRVPWIRMADRDFTAEDQAAGTEPIITEIRIGAG